MASERPWLLQTADSRLIAILPRLRLRKNRKVATVIRQRTHNLHMHLNRVITHHRPIRKRKRRRTGNRLKLPPHHLPPLRPLPPRQAPRQFRLIKQRPRRKLRRRCLRRRRRDRNPRRTTSRRRRRGTRSCKQPTIKQYLSQGMPGASASATYALS